MGESEEKEARQARIAQMKRIDAKNKERQAHTMRVVAEAERLVAEVNEVLAAQERLFARHNITKEQLVAMLKKIGGTKLESELKERMAQFQKNIQSAPMPTERANQPVESGKVSQARHRRPRSLI